MSTESIEEYLEAIYDLNERGSPAKTTELAEKMKVSPPSVTQMVKRLADDDYIEYHPYKGASLTGKGMAVAQRVVRRHRLLERFLYDFLKMRKESVHEDACRLEHSLSEEAAAALCKALNKPQTCPDDARPIPPCLLEVADCEQCAEARRLEGKDSRLLTQLANLRPGEVGRVSFLKDGASARQRALDTGLTLGTRLKIITTSHQPGPVEVEMRGTTVTVDKELAQDTLVEIEEDHPTDRPVHPHGPYHDRDATIDRARPRGLRR